jgi:hypothetical protein
MVAFTIGKVSPHLVDEDELKKLGEDIRRTDNLFVFGALIFAVFAVILAASLAYIWVKNS